MTESSGNTRNDSTIAILVVVIVFIVALLVPRWQSQATAFSRHRIKDSKQGRDVPAQRDDQYVSSTECRSCHPGEYASWHESYHRTMTQLATPESVLGAFDGTTVRSDQLEYRVFEKNDRLWAEMPDPEELMYVVQGGKPTPLQEIPRVEREVVMSTGSHHYQTYWVTGAKKYGNLLQTLPLVYLRRDQRWIPREAAFLRPSETPRMVTQWNHHCIRCHSTGGNPGVYGEGTDSGFRTEVGELGIACEACHGPGQQHIDFYQDPIARYSNHLVGGGDKRIVNPDDLDHRRSSQVCGQCHSVYIMRDQYGMKYAFEGVMYRPGDDLERTRLQIQHPAADPSERTKENFEQNRQFYRDRWWDDGSVLAGGREFTALSASACYERGTLGCMNCHTMHHGAPNHQLKPGMDTNAACVSCHDQPRFTSEIGSHTHHEPGSSGTECMNCHMPQNTYALFSAIRSHQIAEPSVAASIEHGTPNACNLCHLDKTLAWTEDHMVEWYGVDRTMKDVDQDTVAAGPLWMLKGNAAQRAIASWHAGWGPAKEISGEDWLAPYLAVLLHDSYGVVRYVAFQSLKRIPGFENFEYDFLADADERGARAEQAGIQWQKAHLREGRRGSELLINNKGILITDRLNRLLDQRDNRPVYVKE